MLTAICLGCALAGHKAGGSYDLAFVARFYYPEKRRISHAYLYLSDLEAKHRRRICRVASMWISPFWVGRSRLAWVQPEAKGVGIWVVDAPRWKPLRLLVSLDETGYVEVAERAGREAPAVWVGIGSGRYLLTAKCVVRDQRPSADLAPGFGFGSHRVGSAEIVHGKSGWCIEMRAGKKVNSFPIVNAGRRYRVTDHIEGATEFSFDEDGHGMDVDAHYQGRDPKRTWMVAKMSAGLGELAFLFTVDWARQRAENWLLDVADLSVRPLRGLFVGRSEGCVKAGGGANVWANSVIVGDLETGKVRTVLSGDVFVGGVSLRP